ncbi:hypothetical protein [Streptodolium elevatio]
MTARRWQDVKADAYRLSPLMADPDVLAAAQTATTAYIAGYHLAELRPSD